MIVREVDAAGLDFSCRVRATVGVVNDKALGAVDVEKLHAAVCCSFLWTRADTGEDANVALQLLDGVMQLFPQLLVLFRLRFELSDRRFARSYGFFRAHSTSSSCCVRGLFRLQCRRRCIHLSLDGNQIRGLSVNC